MSMRSLVGAALTAAVLVVAPGALGEGTPDEDPPAEDPRPIAACGERTAQIEEVARKLRLREATLDSRERTLRERATDLSSVEEQLDSRLAELTALRVAVEEDLQTLAQQKDARVDELVGRVKVMRAKDAATLLALLEPELAATVLLKMDARTAGKAIAAADPAVGARLATGVAALEVGQ